MRATLRGVSDYLAFWHVFLTDVGEDVGAKSCSVVFRMLNLLLLDKELIPSIEASAWPSG